MKKILFTVPLVVLLAGCGAWERNVVAHYTGYSKICVEGVSYLQFTSGAAVQLDKNGNVVTCGK